MLIATAADSRAAALLSPATGPTIRRALLPGVTGVRRLALDRTALAGLRAQRQTIVEGFPLSGVRTVDLVLARFSPFSPAARVEVVGPGGPRSIPLPDNVYFTGTVSGEPESRVVLVAGPNQVNGFIVSDGIVHPFGPDAAGGHQIFALPDADPARYPPPGNFCANDLHPEVINAPAAAQLLPQAAPLTAATTVLKVADIAIETDQELRAKFPSDQATLTYLASLLAAATAIYERDVAVRLQFSYIRLWDGSPADPWTATSTSAALTEVRDYWNNPANNMPAIAGPRDLVHFISGKSVQGGIAYLSVLCNASVGYGVSQVFGSFDLANPQLIWDVVVLTHELGHNFGSPHSHCYNPPLDHCYNAEGQGCYAGPVEVSHGTLMSYCHLLAGGLANIDMLFGSAISTQIGSNVAAASCLAVAGASTTTTSVTSSTSTTSSTAVGATTSTSTSTTSSTSLPHPSTTSTTNPRRAGDGDGDGIPDAVDQCLATPLDDLVDATGCSVCPCDGPGDGDPWISRAQFFRCVRAEARRRLAAGELDRVARKAVLKRARQSSCARPDLTRCCLYLGQADFTGACRLLPRAGCATHAIADDAIDLGAGSCLPNPCAR